MAYVSYPTIAAFMFDVPEPENINAEFSYRYFLKNERTSTNGRGPWKSYLAHGRTSARLVKISYTPLSDSMTLGSDESSLNLPRWRKIQILKNNKDKIISELDIMGRNFSTVTLQDTEASQQLQAVIESSLRIKKVETKKLSPIETVLKYNSVTSDKVSGNDILKYTEVEGNNEYNYIDPATGQPFAVQQPGEIDKFAMSCTFNDKFVRDILKDSESAPLSPLYKSISGILTEASEIQDSARANIKGGIINYRDYEPGFKSIRSRAVNTDSIITSGNTLMGYRISKHQILESGKLKKITDFWVTNPSSSEFSDRKIKYGATYRYNISSIYLVRINTYNGRQMTASDILISSRESPSIDAACIETVPPKFPINLSFWMTQQRTLNIDWEHPFNKQEDIKRYQVFRRKTLEEPFTLIAEIDFDDSTRITTRGEKIPDYIKIKVERPLNYFEDDEFNLDSSYIYAVCSVDAHDLSSSYSEQFKVTWDRAQAKMIVEMVSYANAPKPYPNFVLKNPLTVDSIKDSNHSKLKIYFDPEYLNVVNAAGEDLGLLKTSADMPSYKLQLINLDRQASKTIKITVKDKRSTSELVRS